MVDVFATRAIAVEKKLSDLAFTGNHVYAFGCWQSRCFSNNFADIQKTVDRLKKDELPLDALVVDLGRTKINVDFLWSQDFLRGRPAADWIAGLHAGGAKVMLSTKGPMIRKDSENYQEPLSKGLFATDGHGHSMTTGYDGGDLMAFTASGMELWLAKQIKQAGNTGVTAEAETGTLVGAGVNYDHFSYKGDGLVVGIGSKSSSVTISVNVPVAGKYVLALRYANGNSDAEVALTLPGHQPVTVPLPSTNVWDNYSEAGALVEFRAGPNEIQVSGNDNGIVNVDGLKFMLISK